MNVLLVDDSRIFIETASKFLSSSEGIRIIGSANSAEESFDKIKELHPDLVLMDLAMPGIGGLQATKFVKSNENPPKVLVLSIYDGPGYHELAKTVGADGFISKSEFGSKIMGEINNLFNGPQIEVQ